MEKKRMVHPKRHEAAATLENHPAVTAPPTARTDAKARSSLVMNFSLVETYATAT